MTVFISWSGDRSKQVALVLKKRLGHVLQGIETFMSDEDIPSGTQWFAKIGNQLQEASFGIICVTPDNLNSPWLHFEAGAIGNQAEPTRVAPIAIDMKKETLPEPLGSFNAVDLTLDGFRRLVSSLHDSLQHNAPLPVVLEAAEYQWGLMETELEVPGGVAQPAPKFDVEQVLIEMRGILRDLAAQTRAPLRARDVSSVENEEAIARMGEISRQAAALGKPTVDLVDLVSALRAASKWGDARALRQLQSLGVTPDLDDSISDVIAGRDGGHDTAV